MYIIVGEQFTPSLNHPLPDYWKLAQQKGNTLSIGRPSPTHYTGSKVWRIGQWLSHNLRYAHDLLRRIPPHTTLFSTSETWGIPIALASLINPKLPPHHQIIYLHRVYTPVWQQLLRLISLNNHLNGYICITHKQKKQLERHSIINKKPISVISQAVDTNFFTPAPSSTTKNSYFLSVGAEMRDYAQLFAMARALPHQQFIVKLSSRWLHTARQQPLSPPDNVTLLSERISYAALRTLYNKSHCVIVPLHDGLQAAGITTILEAMAMQKPVLATYSSGLPDCLVEGITGRITPRGHPYRLAEYGQSLVDDSTESTRLAKAGHQFVAHNHTLDHYQTEINQFITSVTSYVH